MNVSRRREAFVATLVGVVAFLPFFRGAISGASLYFRDLALYFFPLRRLAHVHPVAAADYFGSNWFMSMMAMLLMNGIPIERTPSRGKDPLAWVAGYWTRASRVTATHPKYGKG